MKYQKIINLLNNTPNQSSKFKTINWVEINDNPRGAYNTNSQIKFKTAMCLCALCYNSDNVMPVLCDSSDSYILVKGTIRAANTAVAYVNANNKNINVIFKNFAPFTDCMSEINNAQVDNAKDIDVVMLMYNLKGYCDNYFKTSGSLWQYCRDEPALCNNNGNIVEFSDNNAMDSFKLKE